MKITKMDTTPPKKVVAARNSDALYLRGCNGGVFRVAGGEARVYEQKTSINGSFEQFIEKIGGTLLYEGDELNIKF